MRSICGWKTTLKLSSSCFSLNDYSGFKLETAEIKTTKTTTKTTTNHCRILEKLEIKGNLHLQM